MFVGGCAGSTAGGLKLSRVMLLIKSMAREIKHMLRPRSVNVVRLEGQVVPEETFRSANSYFAIYIATLIITALAISVDGLSFESNVTAAIACINNVGPGLGVVGPCGNFAQYSSFSKIVLSFAMLFGRLEIVPMIILFSPRTWKKR